MTNRTVTATYYSLAQTKDAVLLLACWMEDELTRAACWTEIDREPFASEQDIAAWDRLKARNMHLLHMDEGA